MPRRVGRPPVFEKRFVELMAKTGDRIYAAEKAGYAAPAVSASQALQKADVQREIARIQVARLNNELLPLALDTLQTVLTSATATERGKLTATALVLKHTLASGVEAGEGKEPHEMSATELEQRIQALRREASDRARPVLEGEAKHLEDPPRAGVFD